jgi:hypothetical protein
VQIVLWIGGVATAALTVAMIVERVSSAVQRKKTKITP